MDKRVNQERISDLQYQGRHRVLAHTETEELVSLLKHATVLGESGIMETLCRAEWPSRKSALLKVLRGVTLTLDPYLVRFPQDWTSINSSAVSAVIGAVQRNGKILAVKNPRGWDLPGGHVERNESPEEALARECLEEGAVTISNPSPVLTLEKVGGDYANKLMILYFADLNEILPFLPCEDSKAREILSLKEFQRRFVLEPNPCKEFLVGSKPK